MSNLSDDDAAKLVGKVINRLPHHHGRIGSAIMEVLEFSPPEGTDINAFNASVMGDALRIIGDSSVPEE